MRTGVGLMRKRQKFANISKSELAGSLIHGSYNVGHIDMTYRELKKLFGQHGKGDGDKVSVHYLILLDDLTYFTIYDYKLYGKSRPRFNQDEIISWSIGGKSEEVGLKARLFLLELHKELLKESE